MLIPSEERSTAPTVTERRNEAALREFVKVLGLLGGGWLGWRYGFGGHRAVLLAVHIRPCKPVEAVLQNHALLRGRVLRLRVFRPPAHARRLRPERDSVRIKSHPDESRHVRGLLQIIERDGDPRPVPFGLE